VVAFLKDVMSVGEDNYHDRDSSILNLFLEKGEHVFLVGFGGL